VETSNMSGTPLPLLRSAMVAVPQQLDRAAVEQRSAWPTVIVSMPFMDCTRPSIQLGLLKASAAAHGFPVRTLRASRDCAARHGADYYDRLCQHRGRMLGD